MSRKRTADIVKAIVIDDKSNSSIFQRAAVFSTEELYETKTAL